MVTLKMMFEEIFENHKKLNKQLLKYNSISEFCHSNQMSRSSFYNKIKQFNYKLYKPSAQVKKPSLICRIIGK